MEYIQTIFMGFVQGLSEFLPISSSAHLVFASALYKLFVGSELSLESSQEIVLDMMLHLGTLFAVFVYYRKKLVSIIKSFFFSIKNNDYSSDDTKLGGYIILGTFVTIFVAWMSLWYTMSASGMWDYKNVLPVTALWVIGIVYGWSKLECKENENA